MLEFCICLDFIFLPRKFWLSAVVLQHEQQYPTSSSPHSTGRASTAEYYAKSVFMASLELYKAPVL
jgi:hypothetical protein